MRMASMKWVLATLIIQFALVGNSAEKPDAAASTNSSNRSPVTNSTAHTLKVSSIWSLFQDCEEENHIVGKSGAAFFTLDGSHPKFNEVIGSHISVGQTVNLFGEDPTRRLRETVLVITDDSNPKVVSDTSIQSHASTLCALAAGNGANVVFVDLSALTGPEKEKTRAILIAHLESKLKGHKDKEGKLLDVKARLTDRQLNVIALFDDSTPNQWSTRAVGMLR